MSPTRMTTLAGFGVRGWGGVSPTRMTTLAGFGVRGWGGGRGHFFFFF